jgi:hypothetical protein
MKMPWQRRTAAGPSASPGASVSFGASVSPGAETSPAPAPTSPTLAEWAGAIDATRLSAETVKEAERFLRTYRRMNMLDVRREIAFRLRSKIEEQVSPPPPISISNMDVIATALTMRRRQLGIGDGPL